MLKKLANAFIEVAKEENLPVNITMGRSYTYGGSRQVGIISVSYTNLTLPTKIEV